MEPTMTLTPELLSSFAEDFAARPHLQVLSHVLSDTDLTSASFIPSASAKLRMDFSVEVPTTGITNQKQSGRCWMFGTMNLVRERVIQACGLKEFSLSGAYLAFYDKLEKGNNFFDAILRFAADPLDSRENRALMANCCCDGGQWDMAVALIEKYGVVPSWVMPETVHSNGTSLWVDYVAEKLREDALELRELQNSGADPAPRRREMLSELYRMLCMLYGQPPTSFDFEYTDKDGHYHCHRGMSPLSFYRIYGGNDLQEFTGIISAPDRPFRARYSQPMMGDVVEKEMAWINLPMEELEALAIRQLQSGEPVFFSCDCHPFRDRKKGLWDPDTFDVGNVLGGVSFGMSKAQRLQTMTTTMNHCMVLCGVNLDEHSRPDRWKIENSWGEENGDKGYFVCSEKWFREYVLQIFVRKRFLNEEQSALLELEPVPMPFWDPLA